MCLFGTFPGAYKWPTNLDHPPNKGLDVATPDLVTDLIRDRDS